MRALHGLLGGFGFLLGFPGAILLIWNRADATPKRVNYAIVGDDSAGASMDFLTGALLGAPIVGALLGVLVAVLLTRLGWVLRRGSTSAAT